MIKLYGIPNCNTVKIARTWLSDKGMEYEFHDFKKQGVTDAMLKEWCAQVGWEALVNKKGLTWRGLSEDEKAAVKNQNSAIRLMKEKSSVIKRPVVEKNGKVITLGFDEDAYSGLFKKRK